MRQNIPTRGLSSKYVKSDSTIFEITAGVGGTEASLFANDLYKIYTSYFGHFRWPHKVDVFEKNDLDGCKKVCITIDAPNVYHHLMYEAGVHRVQRIPATDKANRMHTSTATIAITPKSVIDFHINEKDLEYETKRSSGPGGQHVNKVETAIRVIHKPTGLFADCQISRHQHENKKLAIKKLEEEIRNSILEEYSTKNKLLKKNQVKNADRNEKIRTFHYPRDQITDHRIKKSYYNFKSLMDGDISLLERIINDVHQHFQEEKQ